MSQRKRRDLFTEINITPLTDIFLVLLIIMMVIAPMLDSKGLKLAVPTLGSASNITEEPKALTVHVAEGGSYTIDSSPVASELIQQRLFQAKTKFPDGLIIETEPKAPHGAVVGVMDAARSAGIQKIAVTQAGA